MSIEPIKKRIERSTDFLLTWLLLRLCLFTTRRLSLAQMYGFARGLGLLFYCCFVKHRRIAYQGLDFAFGDTKTRSEKSKIARDCFIGMTKSGVEMFYFIGKPDLIRNNVSIVNRHILDKALERGKGVVLVSAHFGNFIVMLSRLSLAGYKPSVIMRPLKDGGQLERIFEPERARLDIEAILSIPRKTCVTSAIRALRRNKLLLIPLDQNFGTAGVYVDFFGGKAATATGPIVLAQRTGAAIVPVFAVRNPDNTQKIIFEPALILEKEKTEVETIRVNIQKLTVLIESYIRRYPGEWSWIHRRWKSRPKHT
jgi:KDO2-lipid IV(A) lauroyltransferase